MIPADKLNWDEMVFSHIDWNGKVRHFAVDRLASWLPSSGIEPVLTDVEEGYAQYIMKERGIEPEHLERLTIEQFRVPVIYAVWRGPHEGKIVEGVHLLDGHHRYVRYWQLGLKDIPAYIVPKKVWLKFQITGLRVESREEIMRPHPPDLVEGIKQIIRG